MGLTQVSTSGIKDATVATVDIADQAVTLAKLPHGTSSNNGKFLRANNGADPTWETVNTDLAADTTPQLGGTLDSNGQNIQVTEGEYISFASSSDPVALKIYHNGTDGYIDSTGNDTLFLRNGTTGGKIKIQGNSGEESIIANHDGSVELYYDNSKKLETTSSGVSVTGNFGMSGAFNGNLVPDSDSSRNLGANGTRWANVYADTLYGDGSNLTGISAGVSVSNNANNRVITGDGTNLVAESALVFDGTKLGIGTHTGLPNTKFDIGLGVHVGTGDDDAADWGANNVFQLTATGGNAANNEVLMVGAHSGGVGQIASGIGFGRDSTTNWGTYLSFKTHPTSTSNIDQLKERVKIFSDGRVSMTTTDSPQTGASSSANELTISGDSVMGMTMHSTSTTGQCNIYFSDPDSAYPGAISYLHQHNQLRLNVNGNYSAPVMQFNSDLTIYFQNTIYSNGASYSTGSDLRMKSNLVKFTDTLHNLKSINGYKFDIKNNTTGQTRKSAGLIAQEVEKIYPDFVVENPETGMKSLEYTTFTGVLVEAVKELTTKVESLETKVAALEAA